MKFYGNLVGQNSEKRKELDIVALRDGKELSMEQITDQVKLYLKRRQTGDDKTPGLDGYIANF